MSVARIDHAASRERAQLESLRPGLDAFKGVKGFRHQVKRDKDGRILKQRYRFNPSDGKGGLSPAGKYVQEMHKPYWQAKLSLEAKLRHLPGDYGLKGMGSGIYAADVQGDWCDGCGLRRSWCECAP